MMACKKNMMSCSVSKLKELSIWQKIPFQLNCKLHNMLMLLHVESGSCDCSGVGLFLCKKTSWKTLHFQALLQRQSSTLFLTTTFFQNEKKIHSLVGTCLKRLILDPVLDCLDMVNAAPSQQYAKDACYYRGEWNAVLRLTDVCESKSSVNDTPLTHLQRSIVGISSKRDNNSWILLQFTLCKQKIHVSVHRFKALH